MCIAIPVKLTSKKGNEGWVEMGSATREANLVLLPEAQVGDYVLIHAGFAISKVEEKEVRELLELLAAVEY